MFKCATSLLHLTISILLIFCAHPVVKECAQNTLQSIGDISCIANFAPAILESSAGITSVSPKESYNSFKNSFHHALIIDQLFIKLTHPLFYFLLNSTDHFGTKTHLDVTPTRAPPIFIF